MQYFDPSKHHRRSCRLKGYDYSKRGLYFVTNCCQNFDCLFGTVVDGEMIPNEAGEMISRCWLALTDRFRNIQLHEFIVMPNHFHGIIEITIQSPPSINPTVRSTLVVGPLSPSPISINPTAWSTLVVDPSPTFIQSNNPNDNRENLGKGQPQGLPGQVNNKEFVKDWNITIGDVMDAFKSITTVEYIRGVKTLQWKPFYKKVWQRDYFDVIIRNSISFVHISSHIRNNPKKWRNDKFHSSI